MGAMAMTVTVGLRFLLIQEGEQRGGEEGPTGP